MRHSPHALARANPSNPKNPCSPSSIHLACHQPLLDPHLGVTTHPCVASFSHLSPQTSAIRPQPSTFFRLHHITLVFSRFMTSTLDSISPWSFIITPQKYEYYFKFSLFRQFFIDFSSLFLQNNKTSLKRNTNSDTITSAIKHPTSHVMAHISINP